MSMVETDSDGPVGFPLQATGTPEPPRWPRRRIWLPGIGVVALAILGILLGKAAVYQPVSWGEFGAPFPGMPPGIGIRSVNNFALLGGDYYVPPQRGVFSFGVSIINNGSRAVVIEGVTLDAASDSGPKQIWLSGPVLYTTGEGLPWPRAHVLHDIILKPGRSIFIGVPMRTWPCGQVGGWLTDPTFYVQERFLFFHHTVALPWSADGAKLIMRDPGGKPGDANTLCAPQ